MTTRYAKRPARRDIRNSLAFMAGETAMEVATHKKTGPQKESKVNDAVKEWARVRRGELYRNRRGMVSLPNGGRMPIGLGPNGTGDLVGPMPITITPEMVGRTVAIYCELEQKTSAGRLEEHQIQRIEHVRSLGGIAGCCRSAQDAEDIYQRWLSHPQGKGE